MSTDHALVIYEALQGVNGARLVVKGEEAMLIVLQHEHANKVSMERFPLGKSMDAADLVKLLDGLGLIDVGVAVGGKGRAPKQGATVEAAHICPECGHAAKSRAGLGVHRKRKHGIGSSDPRSQAKAAARGGRGAGGQRDKGARETTGDRSPSPLSLSEAVAPCPPAPPGMVLDPETIPAVPLHGRVACDVCGAPWTGHARCGECAALLGPGHTHDGPETVIRGKALCPRCVGVRRRAGVAA